MGRIDRASPEWLACLHDVYRRAMTDAALNTRHMGVIIDELIQARHSLQRPISSSAPSKISEKAPT